MSKSQIKRQFKILMNLNLKINFKLKIEDKHKNSNCNLHMKARVRNRVLIARYQWTTKIMCSTGLH